MQIGDFVKGKEGNGYGVTDECMTKGIVTKIISSETIEVEVLEHTQNLDGCFKVNSDKFEVIGHAKPFIREEVIKLLLKVLKEQY